MVISILIQSRLYLNAIPAVCPVIIALGYINGTKLPSWNLPKTVGGSLFAQCMFVLYNNDTLLGKEPIIGMLLEKSPPQPPPPPLFVNMDKPKCN